MGLNKGIDSQLHEHFAEDTMTFIIHQKLDNGLAQKKNPKTPFPYIVSRKFVQEKNHRIWKLWGGQDKQSNRPKQDCLFFVMHF